VPVTVELTRERVAARRLARVADRLLRASTLCALATVSSGGRAYINAMYFARGEGWDLVWISARDSRHSRNVRAGGSAAITVYDSHQRWGGNDRGIQVFGRARELTGRAGRDALASYARRFHAADRVLSRFVPYRLRPTRLKLFDEREWPGGTFVTARVARDGTLAWERTETYRD
jgi:uncharacterized protein YhbP (UPF0306 family)